MRRSSTAHVHELTRFTASIGAACSILGASTVAILVYQRLTGATAELYGRGVFLAATTLVVLGVQIIGSALVGECLTRLVVWWRQSGSD